MTKQHRNKAGITENAEMTKQEMNLWAKTKQVVIRMRQYQYSFSNVKQRTTLIYDKVHKISKNGSIRRPPKKALKQQ